MDFREFLESQERRDESLMGLAKAGWNTAVGGARVFDGLMTMGDEAIAKAVGAGTKGRMRGAARQFGRGVGQMLWDDPAAKGTPAAPKENPARPKPAGEWHYERDGRKEGPFTAAELLSMARAGKLRPEDLVWKKGMPSWKRAGDSSKLFPKADAAPKRQTAPSPQPETKVQPKTKVQPETNPKKQSKTDRRIRELWVDYNKAENESKRMAILAKIAELAGPSIAGLVAGARKRGRRF